MAKIKVKIMPNMPTMEEQMRRHFYAKIDPRRRQERADADMIEEDHKAIANLPENPINHEFRVWKHVERLEPDFDNSAGV